MTALARSINILRLVVANGSRYRLRVRSFGTTGKRRLYGTGLTNAIRPLRRALQIRTETGRLPRVHDFRHTFALEALLRWYRSCVEVQAKLPLLATYMGHVSIASTEYYLKFVERSAFSATERFARHCGGVLAMPASTGGVQHGFPQYTWPCFASLLYGSSSARTRCQLTYHSKLPRRVRVAVAIRCRTTRGAG